MPFAADGVVACDRGMRPRRLEPGGALEGRHGADIGTVFRVKTTNRQPACANLVARWDVVRHVTPNDKSRTVQG